MNYIYILKCHDNTLYTGWTNNLEKRYKQHLEGKASKYTRARLPLEIVYIEKFETKTGAMKREYEIKQLSREKKLELINSFNLENLSWLYDN